jgi:hypothetical protein
MIESKTGSNSPESSRLVRMPPFSPATLWSPGQVQTAIANEPPELRTKFQGSWYLCGDVSNEMYSLLAGSTRPELALRVFGIETPLGARYGILCHQIRGHVHRFLLPLYEPRVGDFLLAMRGGRLGIQLGRDGSEQAAMLTAEVPVEPELLPLVALASPLPGHLGRIVIGELPTVIAEISDPTRLPPVGPEPVNGVSLSVVLPTQTLAQLLKGELTD